MKHDGRLVAKLFWASGYEKSTEFSSGYSHSWTNGRSETKGKATTTSTGTSLDKEMTSSDGVAGSRKIKYLDAIFISMQFCRQKFIANCFLTL